MSSEHDGTALRFVILHHRMADGEHWDFMLEQESSLATWRLPALPALPLSAADLPLPAERIDDHRKHYLTYEGPLSRDRGEVSRVDKGTFVTTRQAEGEWSFVLAGGRLSGAFTLRKGARGWSLAPAEGSTL